MRRLLLALIALPVVAQAPSKPVPTEYRLQMRILELQAENLRLRVCGELGFKPDCAIDWQSGHASEKPVKQEP